VTKYGDLGLRVRIDDIVILGPVDMIWTIFRTVTNCYMEIISLGASWIFAWFDFYQEILLAIKYLGRY
jgi:hypothetical protein